MAGFVFILVLIISTYPLYWMTPELIKLILSYSPIVVSPQALEWIDIQKSICDYILAFLIDFICNLFNLDFPVYIDRNILGEFSRVLIDLIEFLFRSDLSVIDYPNFEFTFGTGVCTAFYILLHSQILQLMFNDFLNEYYFFEDTVEDLNYSLGRFLHEAEVRRIFQFLNGLLFLASFHVTLAIRIPATIHAVCWATGLSAIFSFDVAGIVLMIPLGFLSIYVLPQILVRLFGYQRRFVTLQRNKETIARLYTEFYGFRDIDEQEAEEESEDDTYGHE